MDLRNKKKKTELVPVKRKYKKTIKIATNVEPSTTTVEEVEPAETAILPVETAVVEEAAPPGEEDEGRLILEDTDGDIFPISQQNQAAVPVEEAAPVPVEEEAPVPVEAPVVKPVKTKPDPRYFFPKSLIPTLRKVN